MPDQSFEQRCADIINHTTNTESCIRLFNLQNKYSSKDIDKAYRNLASVYHPDKNPSSTESADQAMKLINRVKNHLLTGEPFQAEKPQTRNNIHEKTPLQLAIERNDTDLFSQLCAQDEGKKSLLFSVHEKLLTPFEYLIEHQLWPMLKIIKRTYGEQWLIDAYSNIIRTPQLKLASLLAFCVSRLQEKGIVITTTLDENPFLLRTKLHTLTNEERFALIKKKIKQFPALYHLLDAQQQTDHYMILSQYQVIMSPEITESLFGLRTLPLDNISPYFAYILIEKANSRHYHNKFFCANKHTNSFTFLSLNKHYLMTVTATTALLGVTFGLVCAFPAIAVGGTSLMIGIILAATLCLAAHSVYNQIKLYQERSKINKILIENNFFKPEQVSPEFVAPDSSPQL